MQKFNPFLTATPVHSVTRSIRDLRAIAVNLDAADQRAESARLTTTINQMVPRVEQQLSDKRTQVAKLNEEIEELVKAVEESKS